jgi:CBS domain-containing protein
MSVKLTEAQPPEAAPDEVVAGQVMTTSLLAVEATNTVPFTADLMARAGVHHAVVVRDGDCVGLVDDRQLTAAWTADLWQARRVELGALAVSPPRVPPGARLREVAARMLDAGTDAVLVEQSGSVLGLVTIRDVLAGVVGRQQRRQPASWDGSATLFELVPVLPAAVRTAVHRAGTRCSAMDQASR